MTYSTAPAATSGSLAPISSVGPNEGLAARAAAAHRQLLAHPSVTPLPTTHVHFDLPPALEASEPPEARGTGRDDVRLLVSIGTEAPIHTRFRDLPEFLGPGDLMVVNTSATMAASLDATGAGRTPTRGAPVHSPALGAVVGGDPRARRTGHPT